MLKALIFDCDGVIADSEHLHFRLFQQVLSSVGISLTQTDYVEKYLAMDDKGCFNAVFAANGKTLPDDERARLIAQKTDLYKKTAAQNLVILPGVVEFVMAVSQKYPLAMASGALRDEVLLMIEAAGIRHYFDVVVAAEDVQRGKPAPDAYLKALEELNKKYPGKNIAPGECLVVEDSKHGLISAHAAGMKVVAVTTTYPAHELAAADRVAPVLTALRLKDLEGLFNGAPQ
ncbi:MAG: HAD family phosphatase [Elusimicrobia bacterium]|nr:HAD family phosphatase [Elusimicrobiota bacterium]